MSTSAPLLSCQTTFCSTFLATGASHLRRILSNCSFEDDKLTLEELRERIAAEAALHQDLKRVPRRDGGSVVVDNVPRNLQSTFSLREILHAVRTQASQKREGENRAGAGVGVRSTADSPLEGRALDTRFGSMANVADAEGGAINGLDGSMRAIVQSERGNVEESFIDPEVHSKGDVFGDERRGPGLTTQDDAKGTVQLGEVTGHVTALGGGEDSCVSAAAGVSANGRVFMFVDDNKVVEKVQAEDGQSEGMLPKADQSDNVQHTPQEKQHGTVEEARIRAEVVEVGKLDASAKCVDEGEQESTLKPVTAGLEGADPEGDPHENQPSESPTVATVTEGSEGEGGGERGGGVRQNAQGCRMVYEVDARSKEGDSSSASLKTGALRGDSLTVASTALAFDGRVLERSQDHPFNVVIPPPEEVRDGKKVEEETGASRTTEEQLLGVDATAGVTESGEERQRPLATPPGDVRGPNNQEDRGRGLSCLDEEQPDDKSSAGIVPPRADGDGYEGQQEKAWDAQHAGFGAGVGVEVNVAGSIETLEEQRVDVGGAVTDDVGREDREDPVSTGRGAACPSDRVEYRRHGPVPGMAQGHDEKMAEEMEPEADDESPEISRQAVPRAERVCGRGGGGPDGEESGVDLVEEAEGLRFKDVVGFDTQEAEESDVSENVEPEIVLPGDKNNPGGAENARDVTSSDGATTVGKMVQAIDEKECKKNHPPEVSTDAERERDRQVGGAGEDKVEDIRAPAERNIGTRGRVVVGEKTTEAHDVSPVGMGTMRPGEEEGRSGGDGSAHEAANGNCLHAATSKLRADDEFVEEKPERTPATELLTTCTDACRQRPVDGTESKAQDGASPREPLSPSRSTCDDSNREAPQVRCRAAAASSASDGIEETARKDDAPDRSTKVTGVATAHYELGTLETRKPYEPPERTTTTAAREKPCDAVRQQSSTVFPPKDGPASVDVACRDRGDPGERVLECGGNAHPPGIYTLREDDCRTPAAKRDGVLTAAFAAVGTTACGVIAQARSEPSAARGGTDDAPRELPPRKVDQGGFSGRPVEETLHPFGVGQCAKKGIVTQEAGESGEGPANVSSMNAASVAGSTDGGATEEGPEEIGGAEISGCRAGGTVEESNLHAGSGTRSTGLRIAGGDARSEEEEEEKRGIGSTGGAVPKRKEEELCTHRPGNGELDASLFGSTNATGGDTRREDASGTESALGVRNDAEDPLNGKSQLPAEIQGEGPARIPPAASVNAAAEDPSRIRTTGSRTSRGQQQGPTFSRGEENGAARWSRHSIGIMDPNVAATCIQATCRRRAAYRKVRQRRETDTRYSTHHAVTSGRAVPKQQPLHQRRRDEQEGAATTTTQRRALAIRRARNLHSQCSYDKKFLFGPSTTPASPAQAGDNRAQRRSGQQAPPFLNGDEKGEGEEQKKTKAAVKIQAQARRRAASRRIAAAKGAGPGMRTRWSRGDSAIESTRTSEKSQTSIKCVPKLQITSAGATTCDHRVPPKVHTEPLAILRQLRDRPQSKPKPKEDNFTLRVTIRSAIAAHVSKTGATRRKAHPLPTPPRWRPIIPTVKFKTPRPQTSKVPLVKPRVFSPLHKSVDQVNSTMSAGNKRRARSAGPSRVQEKLYCALSAAERLVERDDAPAGSGDEESDARRSVGGSKMLEDSSDVVRAPQLVHCGSPPD